MAIRSGGKIVAAGGSTGSSSFVTRVLTGLTPGTVYRVRVRGENGGGVFTGEETVFRTLTLSEDWRRRRFGAPESAGDGADSHDFDRDGLVNLAEFAFGSDPKVILPGKGGQETAKGKPWFDFQKQAAIRG